MNSQFCILFNRQFAFAFFTASSTISIPITFLQFFDTICPIVPVPLNKSKTTLSFLFPIYSITFE